MEQESGIQKVGASSPPSPDGRGQAYCPICGREGDPGLRRFGHIFCSEAHVAQYASERTVQAEPAASRPTAVEATDPGNQGAKGMACGIGTKGGLRKMGWCLAGGVGLLIAIPLIASGGLAATAGSLLSVVAFLACPIGMYFMMRGMMKTNQTNQKGGPDEKGEGK